MPIPTWTPGQVFTASDVNSWTVPMAAVKTSDQSVTSNSTTFINDTALVLTPAINATYLFMCYLDYEGGTGGSSDLQWQWGVPSGATLRYQGIFNDASGANQLSLTYTATNVNTARTGGAGVLRALQMIGTLVMSTTAGTLQLKWAQATSSATSTIVHAQSCLILQRVG